MLTDHTAQMVEETLKNAITAALPDATVLLNGSDCSFSATVISNRFVNIGHLARHKTVMEAAKPLLQSGTLHALSLHTATYAEWDARENT